MKRTGRLFRGRFFGNFRGRFIEQFSGSFIRPVAVLVVLSIFTSCLFEPPDFDNPVDPINQEDRPETDSDEIDDPPTFLYAIGDTGPAGGTIFFVDEGDQYVGWTYLEAAPFTFFSPWDESGNPDFIDATFTGVGDGVDNTQTIIDVLGPSNGYAAGFADLYEEEGFDDWFLPSLNELVEMYLNLSAVGDLINDFGFGEGDYWSSSEFDGGNAWTVNFPGGSTNSRIKGVNSPSRPVRRF